MLMARRLPRIAAAALLIAVGLAGCDLVEIDEVTDPNNPSSEDVLSGATQAQLQNLVTGLVFRHRAYTDGTADLTQMLGAFGREVLPYYNSDPRFANAWLGQNEPAAAENSPDFFADASAYDTPYNAIKQANTLIEATQNTEAVSAAEASGYLGFAKTIQGFQYLIPLNTQFQNGIRIDVADPLNPGPFLGYDEALAAIRALLDEADGDLAGAGEELPFDLSVGFDGYATPAGLRQVNRAIAARAAIYAEDWQGALDALDGSFLDLSAGAASLQAGPAHVFGAPPDQFNPLFYERNAGTNQILMVHPDMIDDLLPGDARGEKFFERDEAVAYSEIDEDALYQDNRYETDSDPIPFIRNEELILIYAEAHAQLGNSAEAVEAINLIRNTWGLSDYSGGTDTAALIDEILFQRRYSLWAEGGHRWIDARRYDRLDEIPTGVDGGRVFPQLARPLAEVNWEESQRGGE